MHTRLVSALSVAASTILLAACGGGGGGGGGSVAGGGGGGGIATSSKTIAVSTAAPQSASFDTLISGITGTITFGTATAGSGSLTAVLTPSAPGSVPSVSDAARRPATIGGSITPLGYITVTATASATYAQTPAVTFKPAGGVQTYGYLAQYDAAKGWVAVAGATTIVGGVFTIAPVSDTFTIASSPTVYAVFTTSALASVAPPGNSDALTCSAYAVQNQGTRRAPSLANLPQISPNRLYVTRNADVRTTQSVRQAVSTSAARTIDGANGVVHEAITLAAGTDLQSAASRLRATSGVISVDPVHLRYVEGDAVANDPRFDNVHQWYLFRTNVENAWSLTHGTGIKVAVIDTGVDQTNTDLASKLDKTESIVGGVTTSSAQDTNGHGTNVAGLAAAQPNNTYGYAGVGWDVHVLAYKIFPDATATSDCQNADTADEAAAIRDAVASGAGVISLSLGAPQSSGVDAAEQAAINYALQNNVTVVAANGNEGVGKPPDYPGGYAGVIGVGASAANDNNTGLYAGITSETVASYSNDGPALVAPGGDSSGTTDGDVIHWIEGYSTTTAGKTGDRCTNSGGVCAVLFNGTSQATPQVSGTVALMLAKHGGKGSLTPAQVKTILQSTANKSAINDTATRQGAGRLDIGAAVAGS